MRLVMGAGPMAPARTRHLRQRNSLQANGWGIHPDVLRIVVSELDLHSMVNAVAIAEVGRRAVAHGANCFQQPGAHQQVMGCIRRQLESAQKAEKVPV